MVVFLGQITNSQLAFNNGTVTQNTTREPSGPHQTSRARTLPEPGSDSPRGKRSLSVQPPWESSPMNMADRRNGTLTSVEENCRTALLEALSGLLDRLELLELSSEETRGALRHDLRMLRAALGRTPLDMKHVHALIRRVQAQLDLDETAEEAESTES
ncbi:hypothetical protein [Streptomyces maremycinicus]|uniref:hypothetical protein n=1 Tax=Streptomyces maremycinicus TaxID=1679753 RepID=UPI000A951995|nr:hypothetical protein [Streptomyces sp. NBRC 110468]